jgi:hypothetical protein
MIRKTVIVLLVTTLCENIKCNPVKRQAGIIFDDDVLDSLIKANMDDKKPRDRNDGHFASIEPKNGFRREPLLKVTVGTRNNFAAPGCPYGYVWVNGCVQKETFYDYYY